MSPELISVLKERIAHGLSKETIQAEMLALGHSAEIFEAAYTLAQHDSGGEVDVATITPALPSSKQLFLDGWSFARTHWRIVALMAVPLVVTALATEAETIFADVPALYWTALAVGLVALVAYLVNMTTALYMTVTTTAEHVPSFEEGFQFTRRHILSLLFIYLLTFLVIMGGFLLFIVPGIIASVSIYFAQYALIHEKTTGMQALLRSRDLVKGRWFLVLRKFSGFFFYTILVAFAIGIVVALVSKVGNIPAQFSIVSDVVIQILSAVSTVMSMYVGQVIYRYLVATKVEAADKPKGQWRYWLLMMGGIAVVGFIIIGTLLMDDVALLNGRTSIESQAVRAELLTLRSDALTYALQHDGSYAGVCATISPLLLKAEAVLCNDAEDAWAISGTVGSDIWCADSTGYTKLISVPLAERTVCLEI